jgi:hypothetical protein
MTIITFSDIIHRLVFCLKCRPVYISKYNVSEIAFYLRRQVKPTQLGPMDSSVNWIGVIHTGPVVSLEDIIIIEHNPHRHIYGKNTRNSEGSGQGARWR